jgi:PAS domain S-box-containing protein
VEVCNLEKIREFFTIKRVYIFVFLSLASWAYFAYHTMSEQIELQKIYAKIINLSGKQRMLSQKTTLIVKRVHETNDMKLIKHSQNLIKTMKSDHAFIINNLTSEHMKSIYFSEPYNLDNRVKIYFKMLEEFCIYNDIKQIEKIQEYSFNLLPKLNYAVYEFEKESEEGTRKLKQRELYIFFGTIITLLLESFLIVLPVMRKVAKKEEELINLNTTLKQRVEEKTKELVDNNLHLRSQKNFLDTLIQEAPVPFFYKDLNGCYTDVNQSWCDFTGFTKKEILGKNAYDVAPKELADIYHKQDKKVFSLEENPQIYESQVKNKHTGTIFDVIFYKAAHLDFNGNVIGLIGFLTDLTEVKKLQKEAIKNEKLIFQQSKMASMGELISNIAHQWRQPLSVISTSISGMEIKKEMGTLNDEEFFQFCKEITINTQYLSQTIDGFRNYINSESLSTHFNLKNITDMFMELIHSIIEQYKIQLVLDLKDDIDIKGYSNELTQSFINIFNNSKDAFVQNNIAENERYIFMSQFLNDNSVVIEIKDSAGGIPNEIKDKIFEPYFTTKHQSQGTGLGLSMTYKFITNVMNGTISVENKKYIHNQKEYNGAYFKITIPLNKD